MQSDLIIINDFCDRCHVDPSFITELEEDGLIEVRVIDEERYLPASQLDRKSTRLNSSHMPKSRMPSSA